MAALLVGLCPIGNRLAGRSGGARQGGRIAFHTIILGNVGGDMFVFHGWGGPFGAVGSRRTENRPQLYIVVAPGPGWFDAGNGRSRGSTVIVYGPARMAVGAWLTYQARPFR